MADRGDQVGVGQQLVSDQREPGAERDLPPGRAEQSGERAERGEDAVGDADVHRVEQLGLGSAGRHRGHHDGLREQGRGDVAGAEDAEGTKAADASFQGCDGEGEGPEVGHPDRSGDPQAAADQGERGVDEQVVRVGGGERLEPVHGVLVAEARVEGGAEQQGEVTEGERVGPRRGHGPESGPDQSSAQFRAGHGASRTLRRAHDTGDG
ncbi:hypothetical protein OU787_21255 [Kitasatospora sp. YST-16]|nr:hypothetical protein [Kitasatospora sp. YST-16]WAL73812.1 hypothetical protein OU787_21255 [Kitasatospora sp. YST-16]WNW39886.1 hypothetical protein RKE32_21210 [Streptomyces sp. Li-HN-5-13]